MPVDLAAATKRLGTVPDEALLPMYKTDYDGTADLLHGTPEGDLLDTLASFHYDFHGFVRWAFPWGEKGTDLEHMTGPEQWQAAQQIRISDKLVLGGEDGAVVEEDIAAGHGVGKAHDVNMVICTPAGPRRWGDLVPGDTVFGADGRPTRVVQTHQFYDVPMYRVTFDDGTTCDVSSGHLWNVRGRQERRKGDPGWRTLETAEILRLGVTRANGPARARQWEIPVQGAAEFPRADLPIDPYLVGLWLGNGSRGRITQPLCPDLAAYADANGISRTKYVGRECEVWSKPGFSAALQGLEVFECRSWEKFIPLAFQTADVEQRKALLAGLLDTDGTADKRGICVYDTTSEQLAADVMLLVRSLGGKARLQPTIKRPFYRDEDGEPVFCRDCYRVTVRTPFNPFRRAGKADRWRPCEPRYLSRWIDSIEPLPNAPHGMCISVEAPDGLYQANDYVVTHNSAEVAWAILWAISTAADTRGVVTANTDTQLRTKTWAELAKWYQLFIGKHLFKLTATAIFVDDDERSKKWRIDAIPWSEERTEGFAGLHNQGKRILVIFDEASAISDKIWEVTQGALTDARTEIIWLRYGNPTRTSGAFFNKCVKPRTNAYQRVDSRDVSFSNKKQIQAWIDEYGDDSDFVRVRVKGMFPRAGFSNFISPDLVMQARRRRLRPDVYQIYPKIMAIDPARFGDDFSVITVRQGLKVHYQVALQGFDGVDLAGRVLELVRKDGPFMCIAYDAIGNGADLDSALRRAPGLPPLLPVQWGQPAKDTKQYFNQRSEAWGKMRDWLEHGQIPDEDTLADELTSLDYGYDAALRIQLQSKKDCKKNGGKSPDRADSLAISMLPELIDRKLVNAKVRPVQRRQVIWSR